ncbi:hypothetical protein H1R20_g694, partial [Candolleomyces eurysporus]
MNTIPMPWQSGTVPQELEVDAELERPSSWMAKTVSFFSNARRVRTRDINYVDAPNASHVTVNTGLDLNEWQTMEAWKLLSENSAPNALHNADARSSPPGCDDGTRVGVISDVMTWIRTGDPPRLLCMTAAAGAGKSALQKTIAERCAKSNILASAFCFSATDSSRNTLSTIVPTMAFQLGLHNPTLKRYIASAVAEDRLIFSKSLNTQMETLVVTPFRRLQSNKRLNLNTFPYAILIDGVSECNGEDRQVELLGAIKYYLLESDLPFRVFIASRPEPVIRAALEPGGFLDGVAYHLQLSEHYDATNDIRLYLRTRLSDIGLRSGDPRARPPKWPREKDIEVLVKAASGQFIYAATVFKYVSDQRKPVDSLYLVITWAPDLNNPASPFEKLDSFYTKILSTAKETYERLDTNRGRDFLLLLKAYLFKDAFQDGWDRSFSCTANFNKILNLEEMAHEGLIEDLRSLVTVETTSGEPRLRMYHESFSDFLNTPIRSKDLFVPHSRIYAHIAKCCFQNISRCPLESITEYCNNPEHEVPQVGSMEEFSLMATPTPALCEISCLGLITCLNTPTNIDIDNEIIDFTRSHGWEKVNMLISSSRKRPSTEDKNQLLLDWVRTFATLIARFQVGRVPLSLSQAFIKK